MFTEVMRNITAIRVSINFFIRAAHLLYFLVDQPNKDQSGSEIVYSGGFGSGGSAKQMLETDSNRRVEMMILVSTFMFTNPLSFLSFPEAILLYKDIRKNVNCQ